MLSAFFLAFLNLYACVHMHTRTRLLHKILFSIVKFSKCLFFEKILESAIKSMILIRWGVQGEGKEY